MKIYGKDREETAAGVSPDTPPAAGWEWRVIVTADPNNNACELIIGEPTVDESLVTLLDQVLRHVPRDVDSYAIDFHAVRSVEVDGARLLAPFVAHHGHPTAPVRITGCAPGLRGELSARGYDDLFDFNGPLGCSA